MEVITMNSNKWKIIIAIMALIVVFPSFGRAWESWNPAARWARGQTLKVCVENPPGDAETQGEFWEAVYEAIAEWNTAQNDPNIQGLTLEAVPVNDEIDINDPNDCDIDITWHNDYEESCEGGPPPVSIHIGYAGLNSRGITRVLKHELGHAEGLDHSAASEIMAENAFSSTNGAPSDPDLNSEDAFPVPNNDDKAGKKAMYGTAQRASQANGESDASRDDEENLWRYNYFLHALVVPEFWIPITEFTVSLSSNINLDDLTITQIPQGWEWALSKVGISGGRLGDDGGAPSPAYLRFWTSNTIFGVEPGQSVEFQISSTLPPRDVRELLRILPAMIPMSLV